MRVYTPAHIDAQTMYILLGQVFDVTGAMRSNRSTVDFERTESVDIAGCVMLDTLFLRLQRAPYPVAIINGQNMDEELWSLIKKQLNSVPDGFLNEALSKTRSVAGTELDPKKNAQIHRVLVSDAERWLYKNFNNWLARVLYTSTLVVAPQTLQLIEVLDNIKKHAGVDIASIATEFDETKEAIRIVISDAGKGIPESIRKTWSDDISDEVAIAKAIESRSSSTDGRVSAQQEGGLCRLIRELVDRRAGKVIITSGFGQISCFRHPKGKVHVFKPANAYYPGTMIDVTFSATAIRPAPTLNEPKGKAHFALK